MIREGQALYDAHCFGCHGVLVVAGPIKDLRYATAEVHDQFEAIVRGGARESVGMPGFADLITSEQLRAIQAFVLFRAEKSAATVVGDQADKVD